MIDKKVLERIDLYARTILCTEAENTYRAAIRDLVRIYVDWLADPYDETVYHRTRLIYLAELVFRHGFDKTAMDIPVNADTVWALVRRMISLDQEYRQVDAEERKWTSIGGTTSD